MSQIKDELRILAENKEVSKDDIKSKLESILFRLPTQDNTNSTNNTNINGDEEHGPTAMEKKLPVHRLKFFFDEQLGKKSEENEGKKVVRYQMNPRANWGPLSRAKG